NAYGRQSGPAIRSISSGQLPPLPAESAPPRSSPLSRARLRPPRWRWSTLSPAHPTTSQTSRLSTLQSGVPARARTPSPKPRTTTRRRQALPIRDAFLLLLLAPAFFHSLRRADAPVRPRAQDSAASPFRPFRPIWIFSAGQASASISQTREM